MKTATIRNGTFFLFMLVAVGLGSPAALAQDEAKGAPRTDRARGPWRAFGRVTDQDGKPLAGVKVRAYCGMATLFRAGEATSGADGRYELDFGPGVLLPSKSGATIQAATITAHKDGCFEANLSRQGNALAADRPPSDEQLALWGKSRNNVFLPGQPREINFEMRPAGRVAGRLIDEHGKPLVGYGVGLDGPDTPPGTGAVHGAATDEQGRFTLEDVPTIYRYQFVVREADPKPPWNDSWASAALRFGRPAAGDLHAWFGDREIRIDAFTLCVAGPGLHGREASPIAAVAGTLNLTAPDPSDVTEKSDARLVAKSAVLTLRNASRQDLSRSLVTESVTAASNQDSTTRLARTRPNDAGAFTISFENPRWVQLEPGKHQVIFQVFVGVSQKPIREKIFRQLEVRRDGRYQEAVTIAPEWIDDSRVSITFVTIQPDHDAWVKSFFHDGKGTKYEGIWTGDDAPLPAIPFEPQGGGRP
jgi:hypothetical protein